MDGRCVPTVLLLLWLSHWSLASCAACQSHGGDAQRQAPTFLSPPDLCSSFSLNEGDGEPLFWREDRSFFYDFILPFPDSLLLEVSNSPFFLLRRNSLTLSRSFLLFNSPALFVWPPFGELPPCPHSYLPAREAAVEEIVPRQFPTLPCCYSSSNREAAVLQRPHRTPHMSSFWTLPSTLFIQEPMSSRDREQNTTSRRLNCGAGQSG